MDGRLGPRQETVRWTPSSGGLTDGHADEFFERGANSCPSGSIEVVAATNGLRSDQDLTRGLVEYIARGELGAKLRSQVASWHPTASRDEVDDAFQEACLRADGRCRGRTEGEVLTWLRTTI